MADPETAIPSATTPEGVNIHLGYIRRDLLDMKNQNQKDLKDIKDSINGLGDHYVSEEAFGPVAEQTELNRKDLVAMKEWKDTLNGKLIGFGFGISATTAVITFAITHFF